MPPSLSTEQRMENVISKASGSQHLVTDAETLSSPGDQPLFSLLWQNHTRAMADPLKGASILGTVAGEAQPPLSLSL